MISPVKILTGLRASGNFVVVTIKVYGDYCTFAIGAPGSPEDADLVARLRGKLADALAEHIRTDRWPETAV